MKISHYAALQNAIKNNEKLAFAKSVLSKEQFERLYKSYRNLFWFQIMPVIVLAVAVVLELIFIPSENVPNGVASLKETIIIFEAAFLWFPFFRCGLSFLNLQLENYGADIQNGVKKVQIGMEYMIFLISGILLCFIIDFGKNNKHEKYELLNMVS